MYQEITNLCNVFLIFIKNNFCMDLTWYNTLNKPDFNPPAQVFGPVWAFMYTLIFISFLFFLYSKKAENKTPGFLAFIIQILLNFSWSPVFFMLHNIELSFAIIILLIISIILTIIFFYRISKISGLLLLPYLAWTCFVAYLDYSIMVLN